MLIARCTQPKKLRAEAGLFEGPHYHLMSKMRTIRKLGIDHMTWRHPGTSSVQERSIDTTQESCVCKAPWVFMLVACWILQARWLTSCHDQSRKDTTFQSSSASELDAVQAPRPKVVHAHHSLNKDHNFPLSGARCQIIKRRS